MCLLYSFIYLMSNQTRVLHDLQPSRNQDTLISLLRRARPIGMSTCNHNRISHIYYCLPLIPFAFPFSVKREEATSRSFNNASTVLPNSYPFPRLRPQRPPKWNYCWLHEGTHGWSSSSQGGIWTSQIEVWPRWRRT